jgi:hypothetical protein
MLTRRSAYEAACTPQLLLLVSDLLETPPAFGARHKALLQALLQPLQEHLAELSAEQLTQVRQCTLFNGLFRRICWDTL